MAGLVPAIHVFHPVIVKQDVDARAKPAGAKGTYIQRVAVSSTMGPGVKVEPGSLHD